MYVHSSKIYFCLCLAAIFVACSSADKIIEDGDRITNGQNATIDQLPYIVQIVYKYAEDNNFICGGTIVSDRHVISAAHCFIDEEAEDLEIVANATYMDENKGGIRRDVEALYKHPKFDYETGDYDGAVIKLSEPLTFGQGVQKIEMCSVTWRGKEKIIIAGWGYTAEEGDKLSNQLQMVKLDTVSPKRCREGVEGTSRMACSIVRRGKDACKNDSGGPAIYNGKLCGVVSFSDCGKNGALGVYASIPKLRKFIEHAMTK